MVEVGVSVDGIDIGYWCKIAVVVGVGDFVVVGIDC